MPELDAAATARIPTLDQLGSTTVDFELRPIDPSARRRAPDAAHRLAAIVLFANLVRRSTWEREEVLEPAAAAALLPEAPPPAQDFQERVHRMLAGPTETIVDLVPDAEDPMQIHRVKRVRAKVRTAHDRPLRIREVYVPSQFSKIPDLAGFDAALTALIGLDAPPPIELAMDLGVMRKETAYRGGAGQRDPEFGGHVFGDALQQARDGLIELARGGTVVNHRVETYAWPFLVLRYGPEGAARWRALTLDGARVPRLYGAPAPPPVDDD